MIIAGQGSGRRAVICGTMYAENLGDGVIADSLRHMLVKCGFTTVSYLDISGRSGYGREHLTRKGLYQRILRVLPGWARRGAVAIAVGYLYTTRLRKNWIGQLREADVVFIGGGQIFQDPDLNFPLKIYLLSRLIRLYNKPTAFCSIGASSKFSALGRYLFRRSVKYARPSHISARDPESKANMEKLLLNLVVPTISILPDPAIRCMSAYAYCMPSRGKVKTIGLNLSDPSELSQYSDWAGLVSIDELVSRYCKLITECLTHNFSVALFSNGAREDDAFLRRVCDELKAVGQQRVEVMPRPIEPIDLIRSIARLDLVLAHRLHAHIIAYSFGIPSIGFTWDRKVESFFSLVGRSEYLFRTEGLDPSSIVQAVRRLLAVAPSTATQVEILALQEASLHEMCARFGV